MEILRKLHLLAVKKNKEIDGIATEHICVEPFEMPWLDSYENVNVIRKDVGVDFDWSKELQENDLLC